MCIRDRYAQGDNAGENGAIKDNIIENSADDPNGGNADVGKEESSTSGKNEHGSISGGVDSEDMSGNTHLSLIHI